MTQTWTTVDKAGWGEGPWQAEPDKVVWIDPATDLDCMAHRGPMGAWCGYVGVPSSHPWYGKHYDDLPDDAHDATHGGVTYTDTCDPEADEASGLCHVPEAGREGDVWWVGFDCGHAFDFIPALGDYTQGTTLGQPERYKDLTYVSARIVDLAGVARGVA